MFSMCLAVPGKVISVENGKAVIDYYSGEQRKAKLAAEVRKGDYAPVQQGFVVAKVEEKEALEMIEAWKETGSQLP